MKEKITIIIIVSVFVLALIVIALIGTFGKQDKASPIEQPNLTKPVKEIKPSETFIEYTDPAGFSFSYPDNLSIEKTEIEDPNAYADLQIYSKDVNGSIKLKIVDTKFTSLNAWLDSTGAKPLSSGNDTTGKNIPSKKKLGNLDALEVKTTDRLMLGALDQKVLFTIEVPLVEEKFWMEVYEKILEEFSFVSPETNTTSGESTSSDVTFEGEEVIE